MSLPVHCLVVHSRLPAGREPRAAGLLADAHALGLTRLTALNHADLYFIEGELSDADKTRLADELLSDPVAQWSEWRRPPAVVRRASRSPVIEVSLRPGVTDPVAEQIVRAAHELGIRAVQRAATGQRYTVEGRLTRADQIRLARQLLANDVIQRYALGEIEPHFPQTAAASAHVQIITVRALTDADLLALSRERRAALDLAEMRAIQHYYHAEGRDPSDVEFETIAQTWSEHCVHKTFKALIEVRSWKSDDGTADRQPPTSNFQINGLLRTFIRAATEQINAPWVRSAFVDNAGVIDFDDEYEVSFKVETHNHPSAIEPFGGANTGVGGVIRDVLGVSAKPIAATDVLCFGPLETEMHTLPEGVLHPRRIRAGVVAGVQDYGNKIGLPTVNGAILYDAGYTANPLVFCGCVGLAPKNRHPREPRPGDRVIVLGGRTGRDGLRGATFSSMTMDAQTGEVAGASVQIGDPITEKGLIDVIVRARDLGLYHAITDCGAGGLSSAVGEMASRCGADVELRHVRLKYPGLAPWEIWLSEAQERMVLAVPEDALPQFQMLCDTFNVELTDLGLFTDTGRLVVRCDGEVVLDLANAFLHEGLPQRRLRATVERRRLTDDGRRSSVSPEQTLLQLLSHPNIASKADVIRVYDHEVQGGTVVKPLTGARDDGPSDACVLKPAETKGTRGLVLANGINPEHGRHNPYRMAVSVMDEAIRNAVAVGADPDRIALLDNFCWGDPARPETLGALVEAARGCHDAALHYRAPFISGKDSLNNEYLGRDGQRHAIPPTLLISALGLIEDVNAAVTMDLKEAGNALYVLGALPYVTTDDGRPTTDDGRPSSPVPDIPAYAPRLYRALHRAMRSGLVRACHDLSEGGLAVAIAEMCIGGRLGAALTVETGDPMTTLFGEVNGALLCEVRSADCPAFEHALHRLPFRRIGMVTGAPHLSISTPTQALASATLEQLVNAWRGHLP
jgi:phosphoribosylformylglycinamidine synthase